MQKFWSGKALMFKGDVTGVLWPACTEYNCLNIDASCVFPFLYSYKSHFNGRESKSF